VTGLTPSWAFTEADRQAMQWALVEAEAALAADEVPVGAVVVSPLGDLLARAGNRRERDKDPTAHAEILALRQAGLALGQWRLEGCTLYVTVEPCAMCAAACVMARLECVVWGAPDPRAGFAGTVANLLADPRFNHRVAWRGGLAADAATALMARFFAKLRSKG
jgi:tRNA(adenine34) deaminase